MIREIQYESKEEWLALRRTLGVGGSDAASVVGLNPYKGAYTLWAEKTGRAPEFEGNLTTEVGSYLEEFVAKKFTQETGKKVRRKNRILVNDLYPFAFADVDRLIIGENAFLEIKTTNSLPAMRKLKNGEFPETWYAQIVHYLAVGGFKKAYLAVLINCREFKIFELDRDDAEIEALMLAEEGFWKHVITNTPPVADGLESTSATIGAIYPESTEGTVDLFAWKTDLDTYEELSARIAELERERREIANRIKAELGDAAYGEVDGFRVTYKTAVRNSFNFDAFANDHPDVDLSAYQTQSTYRTFKINKKS